MRTRSILQISVRGLVIVVTLIAIGLGVVVNRAMRQRSAVKKVQAVHGLVLYDFHENEEGYFDPNASSRIPKWLISRLGVDYFHPVVFVDFDSPAVTDSSLDVLSSLPQLETLHISNTSITSDGLAKLKGLNRLQMLTLNTKDIDDKALKHISDLPALEVLECHNTDISDEGILFLQTMKQLKKLWLNESKVSEQGISQLRKALPNCEVEW